MYQTKSPYHEQTPGIPSASHLQPKLSRRNLRQHTWHQYMNKAHSWQVETSYSSSTWMWLLVSSPKCFCSYCVYFDICPSTIQSVLTSGHVAGWINTSVSCLVKLPLLFLATLTLVWLVLWVSTKTPTSLQLSWLVQRHGGFFINEILFRTMYSEHC